MPSAGAGSLGHMSLRYMAAHTSELIWFALGNDPAGAVEESEVHQ